MKTTLTQGKALELHAELTSNLGVKSPLKLTVAKNLGTLGEAVAVFNATKDEKFKTLVLTNEAGETVLKDEVRKAIEDGKLNPTARMPYEAFQFETPEGLKEFKEFIEIEQAKEVEVNITSVSLKKGIYTDNGAIVPLEELLDSTTSGIGASTLALLMEVGIITD